jgi:hypothetical protein
MKRKVDVSILFDLGASREPTDIAKDEDAMIGEAMWKEHSRKARPRNRRRRSSTEASRS